MVESSVFISQHCKEKNVQGLTLLNIFKIRFLSYGSYCCDKRLWPKAACRPPSRESGQEHGDRSWCRSHGGVLLIRLLSIACSVCTQDHHKGWNCLRQCPQAYPVGALCICHSYCFFFFLKVFF